MSKRHAIIELHHAGVSNSMIIWAAVSKTWKSPLIFIKKGTKLNANAYIEHILIPASQAMKKHFEKRNFTSNKTVLLSICPEKLKRSAKPIFRILEQGNMAPCFT